MTYDKLSDLLSGDLRTALRQLDFAKLSRSKDGLTLCQLRNDHRSSGELLLPELPSDALIPYRYEGQWERPLPELSPEPMRTLPIGDAPILARFAMCAIYG